MTAPAYDEMYLDDAMACMGGMFEYVALDIALNLDAFFGLFVSSGIAEQFGYGNPRYVAGLSGVELARAVLTRTGAETRSLPEPIERPGYGPEYWAGWTLAYYQWFRAERFVDLMRDGLTAQNVMNLYVLHEADLTKFTQVADKLLSDNRHARPTRLQMLRKARGLTQAELAIATGVSLRMIQLYEQRRADISKAEARSALALAHVLGCSVEDVVEPPIYCPPNS